MDKSTLNPHLKITLKKFLVQLFMIQTLGFVLITGLFIYSEYSTKHVVAEQIANIVEGRIKTGDNRGAIYALSSAEFRNFSAIGYFDKNNKRIFTLPSMLSPDFFDSRGVVSDLLDFNVNIGLFFDERETNKMGELIFVFSVLSSFFKGILIWIVLLVLTIPFIRKYWFLIVDNIEKEMSYREAIFAEKVSRQVRHDLAGAMQQIFDITEKREGIPETEKKSLLSAISRIEKTLQDLPGKKAILGNKHKGKERNHNIAYIVQSYFEQNFSILKDNKNINIELNIESIDLFSKVQANDFYRCIQNLVENSTQAKAKNIQITLTSNNSNLEIIVKDDGVGISESIQSQIEDEGFSHGKENGSGLGLSFIKEKLQSWNGSLKFSSQLNEGSTFIISLENKNIPSYHPNLTELKKVKKLVILDDDSNIHERVHSISNGADISVLSFFKGHELESFLKQEQTEEFFAFIDYDLGKNLPTGLEIIRANNIKDKCYLLTANYDENKIIEQCEKFGIKIVPKNLINYIL